MLACEIATVDCQLRMRELLCPPFREVVREW
jgi:hypothetical protein